ETFQWQSAFWSVQTGARIAPEAAGSTSDFTSAGVPSFLDWSPDGKSVAASNLTGISVYDVAASQVRTTPWPPSTAVTPAGSTFYMGGIVPLAWSPDGQRLFSGGDEVRQWRASDLKLEYSYGVSGPIAISPDGRTLATPAPSDT